MYISDFSGILDTFVSNDDLREPNPPDRIRQTREKAFSFHG
jgi:hypothetical protein